MINLESIVWISILIFVVVAVVCITVTGNTARTKEALQSPPNARKPLPIPPAPPNPKPKPKTENAALLDILKSSNVSITTKLKALIANQKSSLFANKNYCPALIRQIPEFVEIQTGREDVFCGYIAIASCGDIENTPAGIIYKALKDSNPHTLLTSAFSGNFNSARITLAFSGWVDDCVDGEFRNTVSVSISVLREPAMFHLINEGYIPMECMEFSHFWTANRANEDYIDSIENGFNEHIRDKARYEESIIELAKLVERSTEVSVEKARRMRSNKQRSRLPLNSQNGTLKYRGQRLL